jgi:hypothetical protein
MTLNGGTTPGASDINRTYSILGNITPQTTSTTKYYSIVQNRIFYKFEPGRFPSLSIAAISSNNSYSNICDCIIVGNLADN